MFGKQNRYIPRTKQATRTMHVTCVLLGKQIVEITYTHHPGPDLHVIPDLIRGQQAYYEGRAIPDWILNRVQDTAHAAWAA